MLKWLLYVVLGLGGLVALVAVVGSLLPKGHHAALTEMYSAPPEAVFAALANVADYAAWRSDVARIEMLPPAEGRTVFREHGGQGPITFRIEALDPPSRMVTRIADPSLPFGGTWTFEVKPSANGAALTITEDGEVYNPIFRFMSKFVFSPTATIAKYQAALHKRLGA